MFFIGFEGLLFSKKIKYSTTTFKIKTGYTRKLHTQNKTLLGSTKNDIISKEKNRQNVAKLETTEVVLLHCNVVITIINKP